MSQDGTGAWIDMISANEAEGELRDVYEGVLKSRGKLANIIKVHSLNPAAMRAHLDLYLSIMFAHCGLSRAEREMVAVVVSAANRCAYCMKHHGEALAHYWKDRDRVDRLVCGENADLSVREEMMVETARKLTLEPGEASEKNVERLREVGLSDEDILNLTLVVGYFNFVNRVALGLGVEVSEEEMAGYKY